MKKFLVGCGVMTLIAIVSGGIFLFVISDFSWKTETTNEDGETVVTYNARKYEEEIWAKIDEVYEHANAIEYVEMTEAEILAHTEENRALIVEVQELDNSIDEVKGDGVEEYRAAIQKWATDRLALLDNEVVQMATAQGDDLDFYTQEDVDMFNSAINSYNTKVNVLTEELNEATEKFEDAN